MRQRLDFNDQHSAIFSGFKGIIHRVVMCDKLAPRPFGKERVARSAGLKVNRTHSMNMQRQKAKVAKSRLGWLTEAIVVRLFSVALLAGVLGLHLEQTCTLSSKVLRLQAFQVFRIFR